MVPARSPPQPPRCWISRLVIAVLGPPEHESVTECSAGRRQQAVQSGAATVWSSTNRCLSSRPEPHKPYTWHTWHTSTFGRARNGQLIEKFTTVLPVALRQNRATPSVRKARRSHLTFTPRTTDTSTTHYGAADCLIALDLSIYRHRFQSWPILSSLGEHAYSFRSRPRLSVAALSSKWA